MDVKYILQIPLSEVNKHTDADIIGINITNREEVQIFKELLPSVTKPLMIISNDEYLPELMEISDRECIFGIINENNYKDIIPYAIKGGHTVIIRTPIDINLAKEMNILTSDMGLNLSKIIIDPDIGGLGYGFEYGYSIMEKIKLENDKYLNMPLISFASEETAKTKEAKLDERSALFLEITSASAIKAAGADYIVLTKPETLKVMRELV